MTRRAIVTRLPIKNHVTKVADWTEFLRRERKEKKEKQEKKKSKKKRKARKKEKQKNWKEEEKSAKNEGAKQRRLRLSFVFFLNIDSHQ